MESSNYIAGDARMREAINSKEDLAQLLNLLFADRAANSGLIGGAVSRLVSCYFGARLAGHVVPVQDEAMRPLMDGSIDNAIFELTKAFNTKDDVLLSRQLTSLVCGVNLLRQTLQWPAPEAREAKAAEPLKVEVVSLPNRVTTTEVKRDPKTRNIVSSVQTVVDA